MLEFSILFSIIVAVCFAPFWGPSAFYIAIRQTPTRDEYARLVIDLLDMGKDWRVDQHYAKHPCGVELWVAGGYSNLRYTAGTSRKMSATDRCRIWYAFTKMRRGAIDVDASNLAKSIVARYNRDQPA